MDPLSLKELTNLIKTCIEKNFSSSYWVIAEISEIRINQKGHCYLELVEKENDEILAKIRATIWSYTYRNLSGWFETISGESLKPGIKILANVLIGFHEVFGISLNIRDIDPNYTIGERARRKQEIIKKLKEDGIFEMNKELPLPLVPQNIAVIASPTSAGYQDFQDQLRYNMYNYQFKFSLFQAIMQGKEAEKSIINALLEVNKNPEEFDVLIIIRGGGATLDLDCFDTYDLASHIAQFPLPVITGIGHERDETITDLVANTKLKTPTAVAEFLISGCRQFDERIEELFLYIAEYAKRIVKERSYLLDEMNQKLRYLSKNQYNRQMFYLKQTHQRLTYAVHNKIDNIESRIVNNQYLIRKTIDNILSQHRKLLHHLESKITLMNPHNILKWGFSITRFNKKAIDNVEKLKIDDIIETEFHKGNLKSKII